MQSMTIISSNDLPLRAYLTVVWCSGIGEILCRVKHGTIGTAMVTCRRPLSENIKRYGRINKEWKMAAT